MDAKNQARAFGNCLFVVTQLGTVRGAHLTQDRSGFGEDVRDAEIAAYLDELATRDHDVLSLSEHAKDEKCRRRTVIDDHCGVGTSQSAEKGLSPGSSFTSGAAKNVVLEGAIA